MCTWFVHNFISLYLLHTLLRKLSTTMEHFLKKIRIHTFYNATFFKNNFHGYIDNRHTEEPRQIYVVFNPLNIMQIKPFFIRATQLKGFTRAHEKRILTAILFSFQTSIARFFLCQIKVENWKSFDWFWSNGKIWSTRQ